MASSPPAGPGTITQAAAANGGAPARVLPPWPPSSNGLAGAAAIACANRSSSPSLVRSSTPEASDNFLLRGPRQGQRRVGDDLRRPQPPQTRTCNGVSPCLTLAMSTHAFKNQPARPLQGQAPRCAASLQPPMMATEPDIRLQRPATTVAAITSWKLGPSIACPRDDVAHDQERRGESQDRHRHEGRGLGPGLQHPEAQGTAGEKLVAGRQHAGERKNQLPTKRSGEPIPVPSRPSFRPRLLGKARGRAPQTSLINR